MKRQNDFSVTVPENFDLDRIFDCGQCFRFEKRDGVWYGVESGKAVSFAQKGNTLFFNGCDAERISDFFDLDTDYSAIDSDIVSRFADNGYMLAAIGAGRGIRILRQDRWEAVCSFIISQNNNIPRIKTIIRRLCEAAGDPVGDGQYSFPSAETVSGRMTVTDLEKIGTGYRAGYILSAAQAFSDGTLEKGLSSLSTDDLIKRLLKMYGIGPKVANCIALFGFGRFDVFPVDVWIKRAMEEHFPGKTPADFGPYRGIAQQYIFYSQIHRNGK